MSTKATGTLTGYRRPSAFVTLVSDHHRLITATTAIVQVEAKPEMHGRLLSLQTVVLGDSALIGGPVLGWIADTVGGRAPIFLGAIVCLTAVAFGYYATRRYTHEASAEHEVLHWPL